LTLISVVPSGGFGPDSIVERAGIVYVANVDSDGLYSGPDDQVGNLVAFALNRGTGVLTAIPGSTRQLVGRPSDLAIARNGHSLVVSLYNAGSLAISDEAANAELVSFAILQPGLLSASPVSAVTSTQRNNAAGRYLPNAIGILLRELRGQEVVVVSESREFFADGQPAPLSQFQTGSVSTFELSGSSFLSPISLDVPTSTPITTGPTNTTTSSCWLAFDESGRTLYVVGASSAVISSFRFDEGGAVTLIDSRVATGVPVDPDAPDPAQGASGFVDIAARESRDGNFLYQLLSGTGTINIYQVVSPDSPLTLVQQISTGLPESGGVMGIAYVPRHP
jgi:6-phosphogluconolactonase (cycloisomerase 2 family)